MITVTIIGCGHGGQALAADLTQRGCKVTLYAHPKHPGGIRAIANTKGIYCTGLIKGFVPLAQVTTNLQQAIANSQYIFIVLPAHAHEAMFIELLAFIKSGQTIITLAANFASLIYLKLLARTNKTAAINLIDIASLPYVCRADKKGSVEIIAVKKMLAAASIPAVAIHEHLKILNSVFPTPLVPYQDVLSLGMNIVSGVIHPAITLLNAGRIGKEKEIFYFYRDGITPEIARLIERLDGERIRIGKRLDLEMYSLLDLMEQYYGHRFGSIYQFFRESPAHNALPLCPKSLDERYITQDVPGPLVSWYCLSKLAQVETLVLGNLISLASLLNNTNYMHTGSNLVLLNLHDKSIEEVKRYVRSGELPSGLTGMYEDSIGKFKQGPSFGNVA